LEEFQKLGIDPGVVVTDADGATKNAVEQVFEGVPTILCSWHVKERVKKKYRDAVGYDEEGWKTFKTFWYRVLQAPTIEEFNKQWLELYEKYSKGKTQSVVAYVRKEWLCRGKKERLVAAWTNEYRHYGTLVTSR
jgi:hypothetical protein